MPEAKKTNTLIEKTILVLKTMKIHMKNGTAPSYKMPEAKKTRERGAMGGGVVKVRILYDFIGCG